MLQCVCFSLNISTQNYTAVLFLVDWFIFFCISSILLSCISCCFLFFFVGWFILARYCNTCLYKASSASLHYMPNDWWPYSFRFII